jgi:chemotaxis protein methyltransferase CheR
MRAADEQRKDLLVWSAGSCSGEEAYTIRILWEHSVVGTLKAPVKLRVIATDKSSFLLDRAKEGLYTRGSLRDLPEAYTSSAFSECGSGFRVRDDIKMSVDFRLQDIRHDIPEEMFDLILCRNLVFTYFNDDLQREVLEKINEHLRDEGYLVTGSQERLPKGFDQLVGYSIKGIYKKKSPSTKQNM